MKKFFSVLGILFFALGFSQKFDNIQSGEVLNYRIHYGILNAGTATLTTLKTTYKGQPHFYVKGYGRTTGAVRAFFKVEDHYESFINYNTGLPSFYVRNVQEGGYTQHFETAFNHSNQTLVLTDKEKNTSTVEKSVKGVQDMLSAFYYLRSLDSSELKIGSVKKLNVWIDDELFPFQLKVVGTENIKTKFGTVNCLRIVPQVISGRVFKDKEGVTLWVSNDRNYVPVAIKAELAVGSLKASLDSYRNVKYPLSFF
ncbi:ATP-dependent exonuclease [Flavobacteriaceae bacterium JJC]|nr:ATP-dependent exonuclease [Flavobacteriaceae bacterium JJC]